MVKENQNIALISKHDLINNDTFHFVNCIIDTVDLIGASKLNIHLIFENCIITNFGIHSCWFVSGFILKNSIVKSYVDYQMGGHNVKPIILEGNIFMDFFNFFDCQFDNIIELKNNVFEKGTNLLGNRGEGFENSFIVGWKIENNVGSTDLNMVGT